MIRKRLNITAILFLTIVFMATNLLSVNAYWEKGINIQTQTSVAINEEKVLDPQVVFTEEVLRLINIERVKLKLAPLEATETLTNMANTRARESSVYFAHKRPNGTSVSTIYSENKLYYYAAGENLSYGFTSPEALVKAWMNSSSHKANIISNKFSDAGVGYYYGNDGLLYCSLLLCKPKVTTPIATKTI